MIIHTRSDDELKMFSPIQQGKVQPNEFYLKFETTNATRLKMLEKSVKK